MYSGDEGACDVARTGLEFAASRGGARDAVGAEDVSQRWLRGWTRTTSAGVVAVPAGESSQHGGGGVMCACGAYTVRGIDDGEWEARGRSRVGDGDGRGHECGLKTAGDETGTGGTRSTVDEGLLVVVCRP